MLKIIMSFFMSDIIAKGIAVLFIPLFAYYLGPRELGLFAEWFSIYNILIALFSFGIGIYILVLLSSNKVEDKEIDIKNKIYTFFLKWLFLITFISILLVFLTQENYIYFISIIIIAIAFSFIRIHESLLRFYNKKKEYFIFQVFLTLITSVVPLMFVLYSSSWEFRALGLVLSILFILFFCIYKIFNKFSFTSYNTTFRNETIKFGLPIVFMSSVTWVKLLIDLKLLNSITNIESSGILFFTFQVVSIISILAGSLNKSSTAVFFKLLSEGNNIKLVRLIIKLTLVLIAFSIIVYGLVYLLLNYKLVEYRESLNIIYPMIIGIVFYAIGQFLSSKFLYFKKTFISAICLTLSSILHPFLTYFIIYNFHWTNVGLSYLISNLVFLIMVLFFFYSKVIKDT